MYIVEFDRFGFMRLNKQCKQLLNDNILYGKNEITLEIYYMSLKHRYTLCV